MILNFLWIDILFRKDYYDKSKCCDFSYKQRTFTTLCRNWLRTFFLTAKILALTNSFSNKRIDELHLTSLIFLKQRYFLFNSDYFFISNSLLGCFL